MKYYKVLSQYDQYYKNPKIHNGDIYIKDELYTSKEIERHELNKSFMVEINISKNKTYFFFGCRYHA